MAEEIVPEIGTRQIDAILRFLPIFEGEGYKFGEWVARAGQFPCYSYSDEVQEFVKTLYEHDMIVPLDWAHWHKRAQQYQKDRTSVESADLATIRRLLTAHVRADRFTEGHLAAVLKSGHITAMLRRLKEIRDEMTGPAP